MLWSILLRTVVVHTLTYFLVGLVSYRLFNYSAMLSAPQMSAYMRPTSDPIVRAGVLFQPLRGLLFGIVFYLLRDELLNRPDGWLVIWVMLVFIGILATFAPAPSSIEGLIYLKSGFSRSLSTLEILVQSLLLATLTYYWVGNPGPLWLNWGLGLAFAVLVVLVGFGLLMSRRASGAAVNPVARR